jgi:PGF-CTERM protein
MLRSSTADAITEGLRMTDRYAGGRDTDAGEVLRALALSAAMVLSVLAAPVGPVGTAAGAATVSSCTTINSPGVYELDGSINTSGSSCFEITADDVVLDGNGHVVDGEDGSGDAVAIVGSSTDVRTNVTVRNVTLTNWNRSVYAGHVNNTTLEGVTVTNGVNRTVVVEDASGRVNLTDVTVADTTAGGRHAAVRINHSTTATPTVVATDLTIRNGSYEGVRVVAQRVVLRNVTVDGTDGTGVVVDDTPQQDPNVTVRNAHVNDSGENGLYVSAQGEVSVDGVRAANLENSGVYVIADGPVSVRGVAARDVGTGVDASTDGNLTLANVTVRNARRYGIDTDSINESVSVRNVLVDTSNYDAFLAWAGQNVTLEDVRFRNVSEAGRLRAQKGGIRLRNVSVVGKSAIEGGFGIRATANRSIEVTGSDFRDIDGTTIRPESRNGSVTVRDTTIAGSWGYAIDGTANRTMTVENVSLWLSGGVYVSSDGDTVVRDVSAVDMTGLGIEAYASGNLTLVDSYVENVTDYAVLVSGSGKTVVENVHVNGSNSYGVRATGKTNATVRNVSLANSYYGVNVFAWQGPVDVRNVRTHNTNLAGVYMDANGTLTARDIAVTQAADEAGIVLSTDRGKAAMLTNATVADVGGVGVDVSARTADLTAVQVADVNGTDLAVPHGTATLDGVHLDGTRLDGEADSVTVDAVNDSERPAPPSEMDDVGVYLNATNTTADGHLDATIHYAEGDVPTGLDESTLALWRHDGSWASVGGTVDATANTVTANVTTGSVFAPLGNVSTTTPADLRVRVDGTDAPVREGDDLTVDATVENVGGTGDTQTVSLSVGGAEVDSTTVTLSSGESTTVTLTWATSSGDAGDYTATVASANDSASTSVTVEEAPTGSTETATPTPTPTSTATEVPTATATEAPTATATPTSTPTVASTPTPTEARTATNDPDVPETTPTPTSTGTPGFGLLAALVALAGVVLARRRWG